MSNDLWIILVSGLIDMDVEDVIGALRFSKNITERDWIALGIAHDPLQMIGVHLIPRLLITDGEEKTFLSSLLETIDGGVTRSKKIGEQIRLHILTATTPFQIG